MKRCRSSRYQTEHDQDDARSFNREQEPDGQFDEEPMQQCDLPDDENSGLGGEIDLDELMAQLGHEVDTADADAAGFDHDSIMFSQCPKSTRTQSPSGGPRATRLNTPGLNSTNIAQLLLRYLFGYSKRQMTALVMYCSSMDGPQR
jgi:hypothetical protein